MKDQRLGYFDFEAPSLDADEDYAPVPAQSNWVPAKATRDLPAAPNIMSAESEDGDFAGAVAQALSAGAGGVFEHTSAADRTRSDLWRAGGYAGFSTIAAAGVTLATMFNIPVGWFPASVGTLGVIAMMAVHVASLRHSQAGVARYKITTLRGMSQDRLASRERLAKDMTRQWVRLAESQMEHEERMEKERRRARK